MKQKYLNKKNIFLGIAIVVTMLILLFNFNNFKKLFGASVSINPIDNITKNKYSDTVSEICNNVVSNDYFMTISFGIYQNYGIDGNVNVILESTDGRFTFAKSIFVSTSNRANFSYAVPKGNYNLTITKVKKENENDIIKDDFQDHIHNEIINEKTNYFTVELFNKDRSNLIISGHMSFDYYYEYLKNKDGKGTIRLYKNPNAEVSFSQENFKFTLLGAVVKDFLKKHNIRFDYNSDDIGNVLGNVFLEIFFASMISENNTISINGVSFREFTKIQLELYKSGACGTAAECFNSSSSDELEKSFGTTENFVEAFSVILDDEKLPPCNNIEIVDGVEKIKAGYFYLTKTEHLKIPSSVKSLEDGAFAQSDINTLEFAPTEIINFNSSPFQEATINTIKLPSNVKVLGNKLFYNLLNPINKIEFPNSLEEIGDSCFEGTTFENNSINLNKVRKIGNHAFEDSELKSIELGYKLEEIGNYAFYGNNINNYHFDSYYDITTSNMDIPSTIKKIGDYAFYQNQLDNITFELDSSNLSNLEYIGSEAFSSNTISKLVIPNNELNNITIGNNAFYNNQLVSVDLGKSVSSIGSNAFYSNFIENLNMSENIREIKENAFSNNKIKYVHLPNTLTTIGTGAFKNNNLTNIEIPKSIDTIVTSLFENNKITSLVIPDNIKHIDNLAFQNNLIETLIFNVDSNKKINLERIGNKAFSNNLIKEVYFPNTNVEDGYTVTCGAFNNNKIEKITLSENVKFDTDCDKLNISYLAIFKNNNNIKLVKVLGDNKSRYNSNWESYGLPRELKIY